MVLLALLYTVVIDVSLSESLMRCSAVFVGEVFRVSCRCFDIICCLVFTDICVAPYNAEFCSMQKVGR